jgi:hypothetical protein
MVVLAMFVFTANAWSAGVLNMPPCPPQVNVTQEYTVYDWFGYGTQNTLLGVTLSGVPAGEYDVGNGLYPGWCGEHDLKGPAAAGTFCLFDSTVATGDLPATYQTIPWDKVNYLLNNKPAITNFPDDIGDIQRALHVLMGTQAPGDVISPKAQALIDDANANGAGFRPVVAGQIAAVLIYADGYMAYGANDQIQDTLIEVTVPPMGCTLTPGYWKTHSKYGPAKYDSIWALKGEDTIFYSSSKTWYEVLWTPPKGNAYYILAFQYIATKLNMLAGASITEEVQCALKFAEWFFKNHSPSDKLKTKLKNVVIYKAGVLDSYNNGYIGPGHCSD